MADHNVPTPGSNFSRMLGAEVESEAEGFAVVTIDFAEKLLNTTGRVVHGGVIATLMDMAGGRAAATYGGPRVPVVTINMSINYMAPATKGPFRCEGRAVGGGKTTVMATGTLTDAEGTLLAQMQGVWRKMPPRT